MEKKEKVSILDTVPVVCPDVTTRHHEEIAEISFPSLRNARLQKVFGRLCRKSYATFDMHGTFVWGLIDGQRTVEEIIHLSAAHFEGEEDYARRIVTFISSLHSRRIIRLLARS